MKKVIIILSFCTSLIHCCPTWISRLHGDGLQAWSKENRHDESCCEDESNQNPAEQLQEDEQ